MLLNPQQMTAVQYIDGPLLVLAGAGSGKTRVITQKIDYLIRSCAYKANTVVALTFTNKAAKEMQQRLAQTLPLVMRRGLKVATFHTLGLHMLKRHAALCALKPEFSIFDADDGLQLIKNFVPPARANERDYLQALQQQISAWKNLLLTPQQVHASMLEHAAEILPIYQQYQRALQAYQAVDFDDLIRLPVLLLQQHAEVRTFWQQKIRHLLIDEYQDSNHSQYQFVKLLVGERARFTAVGDDDQSIYAWRGARPENLQHLQTDFPNLHVIKLEQNYRSTGCILQAANHLIANNPHVFEKKLWSTLGQGDLIRVLCCQDEQDEAEQVVLDLLNHHLRYKAAFGAYAILYRGNHQARMFERILRQRGVAYQMSGGQSWFAKTEIKDTFAYLRLLCNPADDAAFLRALSTPKRGIGEATLSVLAQYATSREQSLWLCADHVALQDKIPDKSRQALIHFKRWFNDIMIQCQQPAAIGAVLRHMVDSSGYEAHIYEQSDSPLKAQKRLDNVYELLAWIERLLAKDAARSLADVIKQLILMDLLDKSTDADDDAVQLMTLHAAKGLEFPYVYVVGLEEELLPHRVSIDENAIEEERRLLYVGITRAQKTLTLSLAKQRRRQGEMQVVTPSRFLEELPTKTLEWFGRGERDAAQSQRLARHHLDGLKSLLEGV